ncbi:MAG: MFS transporter [Nannocystaceae bacterium]|nr:MFS transporter [bacterium]
MARTLDPLPLLGGLYAVQGLVFGFTGSLLIPKLAAAGVSLEAQTGVLALASLPWVFKLPIALALDRLRPGAARTAGVAMLGLAAVLLGLASLREGLVTFAGLGAAWLGINILLAAQDVCADTLAIDAVPPDRRGRANGVMWAGHHIGATLLSAAAVGAVLTRAGMGPALMVLAGLVAAGGIWAARSSVRGAVARESAGLREVLASPSTWLLGGFASVFLIADVGTGALAGEFLMQRLQWPIERLTTTFPWVVLAGQAIGYGGAALLVDRIGHARSAAVGSVALGLVWIGFALLEDLWPSVAFNYAFIVVQLIATALLYVGLYAWLMSRVNPAFRATHYAVLMSLLNVPRVWAPTLAPDALAALGWPGVFMAAGAMQIALGGLAWLLRSTGRPSAA